MHRFVASADLHVQDFACVYACMHVCVRVHVRTVKWKRVSAIGTKVGRHSDA